MPPIVITEFTDSAISLFASNLRSGTGTRNADGSWTGDITVPGSIGFTSTVASRAECIDFLCRQIIV